MSRTSGRTPKVPTARAPIDALLSPSSVAVVGASPSSFVGRVLLENLRTVGYQGAVYPVNPRYPEIMGWPCYPALEDVPEAPEAVVTAVRIDLVPGLLRAAAERGTRAAVIPGGGFSETGEASLRAQAEITSIAREHGLAVAGPNCMGVVALPRRSALYIGTVPPSLLPGRVALISQSGSVIEAAANMGPRIGFSALVSCGTEAGTTVGDYLRYFADDPDTGAVGLFLEGFRDPAGFVAGARALRASGTPLAVLKVGRSQERSAAIAAHSGTLAGADEVVTGLLRQLGAIRVDDLDELFELLELLGHGKLPQGRRLVAVTDSGGEANLVADHARAVGLNLPEPSPAFAGRLRARWPNFAFIGNPVDPWGVDPDFEALYAEILDGLSAEDTDIVMVALDKVTPWAGANETDLGVSAAASLVRATAGTATLPLFVTLHATGPAAPEVRDPLRAAGVPLLHGLVPALRAVSAAAWWQAWRPRTEAHRGSPIEVRYLEPGPVLSERASREVLAAYGIPLVPSAAARDADTAAVAAERIGFPVVMKADAAVAHKAAAGLVMTGLGSAGRVHEAFDRVTANCRAAGVDPRGVLVQATASGLEIICGMRRDPIFGPVVLAGVGGTLTEVLREVAVRVCPVSPQDPPEMLQESAVGRLLAAAGADAAPVLETIVALSRLAMDHPEVEEADVNPLFVGPQGARAADALVVLSAAARDGT